MSDLISRQAAIDAVDKYDFNIPEYMEGFVTKLRDAMKEDLREDIVGLPSVQPEQPIIKCKDCKWRRKQKDSEQGRCGLLKFYPTGGWYCANGARERRTDGQNQS